MRSIWARARFAVPVAWVCCGCLLLPTTLCAQTAGPPPSKHDVKKAAKLFKQGSRDLAANKLERAQDEFDGAVRLDPARVQYKAALDLARSHMVTNLVRAAEKDRAKGDNDAATAKLQQAHALDPDNPSVRSLMSAVTQALVSPRADSAPIAVIQGPSVGLHPSEMRQSFHRRDAAPSLLHDLLLAYGITPMIDDSVTRASIRVDLDDVSYAEAANALKLLTGTFFVPLDPMHVVIAKDSPDKRKEFDRILAESVSLPGTLPAEMNDLSTLLRSLFDLKQVAVAADRDAISIRGTESELDGVNKTLADLVADKGQVLLDLRLFQIDTQRTRNIGVLLPTSETIFNVPAELRGLIQQNQSLIDQLVSGGLVSPGDFAAIAGLLVFYGLAGNSILAQPFRLFGGGLTATGYTLGQATANLQLNQSETRALDELQIRVADQDTATMRSGTRFPVITGSFSGLGATSSLSPALLAALGQSGAATAAAGIASGIAAAPPQIEYQDLGLTLKATPRVNRDDTVQIALDFKVQALAGQSVNGIPLLASRQFTSTVSAKDGDSVMLVSTLSRAESRALSGIPGLSEIPGLGASTNYNRQYDTTDLVLLMTPHIVRRAHTSTSAPMITIEPHS